MKVKDDIKPKTITWHIDEGKLTNRPDGGKQQVFFAHDVRRKDYPQTFPLFEILCKVSHQRGWVGIQFARFMRSNPDWNGDHPIDFRYVTEEIGGTNHPAW